jgi:protein-disulfide isomerase
MIAIFRALRAPLTAFLLAASAAAPAVAKDLSDDERAAFESVIRDYLLKNPEIIQEAIQELQRKQEDQARIARLKVIEDKSSPLFTSEAGMVIGNPQGDVTLIEFFDYNCGYCKKGLPDIQKVIETDKNIRVILRDFPILSKESQKKQLSPEKFWSFHANLMAQRGRIGEPQALEAAKEAGADMDRLANDMKSDAVRAGLAETMDLAQKLDISGTPSYVLGDEVVVGAVGFDDLSARIKSLRECGKSNCGG